MTVNQQTENKPSKVIHAAIIHSRGLRRVNLFLREIGPTHYTWFMEKEGDVEEETSVSAPTIEEALYAARLFWKKDSFRTLHCGFRYTLPERDEHGNNALFCQMVSSYDNSGRVYFDQELGNNCLVIHASEEALSLWHRLQTLGRL